MKPGFTADTYRNLSPRTVLSFYRIMGSAHSEITASSLEYPRFLNALSKKMTLGLHLPHMGVEGFDFSSKNRRKEIHSCIKKISVLQRDTLLYALFHPPETERPDMKQFFSFLELLPVPLVVENTVCVHGNEFESFVVQCKNMLGSRLLGICLDIPHCYLSGDDWKQMYRRYAAWIKVIHLSDCRNPKDNHMPFGMGGDLSLNEILDFLGTMHYKGILNFEINPRTFSEVRQMIKLGFSIRRF